MLTICYQIKKVCLPVLFLLFSLLSQQTFAQYTYELDKTTRFEKMGAEEGMSSGHVYCIHQDKYGFIWIGTQFGLNLYDGYDFITFNADLKNPHSLPHRWVNSIFEEADGTMWFCTDLGISKYNRSNQTFSNYIPDTINLQSFKNSIDYIVQDGDFLWVDVNINDLFRFNKITGVFQSFAMDILNTEKGIFYANTEYVFIDGSGALWVCSADGEDNFALSKFNKTTETFTHFLIDQDDPESFVGKQVKSMIEDEEGTIWIATFGGGLLEVIDNEKGKFRRYLHDIDDTSSIISNYLHKIFEDSRGNIWIGGKKGFSKIYKDSVRFTNYTIPNRVDFPDRPNVVDDINEDENGELYLSSWGGLFRFDPSTKVLLHYLYEPENPSGIGDNLIFQVISDRTNQIWIVVPNSGINRINQFSNAFIKIQKKPQVSHSLSANATSCFLKDSRGYFWVGTFGGGLNRTLVDNHKDHDHFDHFIFNADDPNSINDKRISAIYEDSDQMLWFGTFWGLNRYDYATNSFTRFQHTNNDSTRLLENSVEAIFEDSQGTFWVGTRNGLSILNRETGKFIHSVPDVYDSSGLRSNSIRSLLEDPNGDLWLGGDYLEKLNRTDTSIVQDLPYNRNKGDIQPIGGWRVVEDDSANLWISSDNGGLYKMNRDDMTFSVLTVDQGMPNNHIVSIEIDDKGFIWVSTSKGLSRIDPKDYSIRNFDMEDGLVSLEFWDRSSYKDDEGWLYFGSRNGFNVFHPDSIKENKIIPPVYITSLNVAGEPKYFDKPLYELEQINLQYNENDFSFDFVALNYINSQKNQYAYMLEGYDDDWKYVGYKHKAVYTNMSPGKYTFRVKGSNNDGYWNEEGATLAVIIHPPFWKTWWAYSLYFLFGLTILYIIFRFYLRRQRLLHNLKMEKLNAENLAELDIEKNKFFSNISHEFRTPLTLILGPLDRFVGKLKNEDQKQELNLVRRNARRLQTLINQLLSLSKIESGKMKLKARPENIVKLTRLLLQSFHSMAEDRGIKLEFESDAEEYIVYIDTIKFEKVVNNLLSNALKFTERGGGIKIKITPLAPPLMGETHHTPPLPKGAGLPAGDISKAGGILIKFTDTGIGIQKEDLPHVFDRFYQVDETQMKTKLGTGIGLALTKELIELHHGTITVDSEPVSPQIGGLRGAGTTFTIFLPSGKDHLSEDEIFVRKDSNGETGKDGSETDDDLLNDDYLFIQDVPPKKELISEISVDKDLPLLLIVEDNEDMRTYIKSYLNDSYNIIEAINGKDGAEKAIEHIPDLIVSDLMMPKLDGNEMTTRLKTDERTSHIPIILLTAKASKESKLEGLETGADDFLTKPFDADELLIRINNLINQRKRLREIFGKKLAYSVSPSLAELKDSRITSMDKQFMKKAFETVESEMSDPEFSVLPFSKQMGLSRMQLHRKLKALTDQSTTEFIKIIRLNKAAVLLQSKSATAAEIAYDVGFNSPSYFSDCFKEHFGKTPLDYAK